MGADLMIIDDPIKNREEADSETHRGKIWDEWIDSFSTRLHPGTIPYDLYWPTRQNG